MIRTDHWFARSAAVLLPPLLIAAPLAAAEARDPTVPVRVDAGPLDRALASLAAQAGVDIGSTDAGVAKLRVAGVRGRMTAARALDRLLRGTPFVAERVDATGFRVRRRVAGAGPLTGTPVPPRTPPRPSAPALPRPVPAVDPAPPPDVVVVAAKRSVPLLRFPGAITVLRDGKGAASGRNAGDNLSEAAAATPILQETALGAGRNKLFIRGVADSSFTGPTQSTAAVYWGDVPVGYTGPDPGLNLYDVERVEILEGPQGTLYGAGAIGGVIRLAPRPPDLTETGASLTSGVDLTRNGAIGGDLDGVVNLPLVRDTLGLRAVGYRLTQGGYIDDAGRGATDVNAVRTTGGRVTLRAAPAPGWTVDVGVLGQRVVAADLQYAERGLPRLTRSSTLAQPFRQDYGLGQLRLERHWASGLTLVSATGYAMRDADSRFDATRRPGRPLAFDTHERSWLLSHETRLSRSGPDGAGWLAGVAVLRATDMYARRFGPVVRQRPIVGTANRTLDAALFGQVGVAVASRLTVTLGERLTHQRSDGEPVSGKRARSFIHGASVTRLDPTLGASWLGSPGTALYARYQSGFRSGGITVASGIGRVADLEPDTIRVIEAGVRRERLGRHGVSGSIGISDARWRHVQADLIDPSGFPFTTNIGDSHILGLEAAGSWVPIDDLTLSASTFVADVPLDTQLSGAMRLATDRVPNTPPFAAAGGIDYVWRPSGADRVAMGMDGRFVGHSVVGSLAPFDLRQGGYGVVGGHAEWQRGRYAWKLAVDNLFDAKGDRFAIGNPFSTTVRPAYTPVRPRSVRLQFSAGL